MASEQPDPATLRALADRLANLCRDCGFDRPTCLADRRERLCAECSAAVALRACADAQERPATRVASMVGLSENIIVLPEAPAAPAAPKEPEEPEFTPEQLAELNADFAAWKARRDTPRPALSAAALRAMAREHMAQHVFDNPAHRASLLAFARAVLAAR
jgi:hypothetical protein